MSNTSKQLTNEDFGQVLRGSYNEVDKSIATSGFLTSKIGHKVQLAISTTTVSNDTETYTFSDSGTTLYQLKIIYSDSARSILLSAERIA